MKIAFFTHYSAMYGANKSMLTLVEQLQSKYKVEVLVICPSTGGLTDYLVKRNIGFKVFNFTNAGYSFFSWKLYAFPILRWWSSTVTKSNIIAELKSFAPDIIYTNSSVMDIGFDIAKEMKVPHVWHLREFGWEDYGIIYPLGRKYLLTKIHKSNQIICISNAIKDHFELQSALNADVIYNGMIEDNFMFHEIIARKESSKDFTFLIAGFISPAKGQMDAIKAFSKFNKVVPNSKLLIAGSGRLFYKLRLKFMAFWLGTSGKVDFLGFVKNMNSLFESADCVLMCSRNEGMGRVTVEGMLHQKPVIGYNAGATPEIITDGTDGYLYSNIQELVSKMQMVHNEPNANRTVIENANMMIQEKFSIKNYVDNCWNLLQRLH